MLSSSYIFSTIIHGVTYSAYFSGVSARTDSLVSSCEKPLKYINREFLGVYFSF